MPEFKSATTLLVAISAFALLLAAFAKQQKPLQEPPMGYAMKTMPLSEVPNAFANITRSNQNMEAITQIRQTLSLYPFLVDGKQWDKLGLVFHDNVWANYSALIGAFHPLSVLKAGLRDSVAAVTTQHLLGTQVIDVAKDGNTGRSVTMFYASHFGTGELFGQVRETLSEQSFGRKTKKY